MNRFEAADTIWNNGASNRLAIASSLVSAIRECQDEGNFDCDDPAVQLILDHLCFLVGMPQPTMQMGTEKVTAMLTVVEDRANAKIHCP